MQKKGWPKIQWPSNNAKVDNYKLKKVRIKNRTCCYFDGITKIEDFDFDILLDKKSYVNTLIYNVLYKNLIAIKSLHIMFDKMEVFVRDYSGIKYLVLFNRERYDTILDTITKWHDICCFS